MAALKNKGRIAVLLSCALLTITWYTLANYEQPVPISVSNSSEMYAVISSSTPTPANERSYDYAFYLPLTVLSWARIGFKCVVILIGDQNQWRSEPALKLIFNSLEQQGAIVIFVQAEPKDHVLLSQSVRLFATYLPGFPASSNDYVILGDSDLWPLKRSHYMPRLERDLILVHSSCCGTFTHRQVTYRMLPMCHVGANVQVWRQIIPADHFAADRAAQSMIDLLREEFPVLVHDNVRFASESWYLDQKMLSVGVQQWIDRNCEERVFRVSDRRLGRLDRSRWTAGELEKFDWKYDSHLPVGGYKKKQWSTIQPLIRRMLGAESPEIRWCDEYARQFRTVIANASLVVNA